MRYRYGKNWYTPREVAELGLIRAPRAPHSTEASYRYIKRLIMMGRLKAKVWGGRPGYEYHIISDSAIDAYHSDEKAVVKWVK